MWNYEHAKIYLDNAFVLSNAEIVDYPIVYSNDSFAKLSGYIKTDLLSKSSTCNFMYGELTNGDTQAKIRDALENCHIEQVEVLLYKKNSKIKITGAPGEMSLSVFLEIFFQYLVNISDSFFRNIPCLKIHKLVCFLLA